MDSLRELIETRREHPMTPYPDADIRAALYLRPASLAELSETEHEWWLGSLSLDKRHPTFRLDYSQPLHPESRFYKQLFDLDGRRGIAAIFRAVEPPPSPKYRADIFVGWVPPEREAELNEWLAFLNGEIAKRLASAASEKPQITKPDAGMEICYECYGRYVCWHCEGTGVKDGSRCADCAGQCACPVCAGAGQISAGSAAQADENSGARIVIRVGRFRELGDEGTTFTLAAARGKRSPEHTSKVVAYLRKGTLFTGSPGLARDVFDPNKVAGSYSTRTDGAFEWPDVLAYYVEHYAVELPSVFEWHMAVRGWVVPKFVIVMGLKSSR